jgi:hypothetical protein
MRRIHAEAARNSFYRGRRCRPMRRDKELAKFEAFLAKEECLNVTALIKPSTRLAYAIRG